MSGDSDNAPDIIDSPASYSYFLVRLFMSTVTTGSIGASTSWKSRKPITMGWTSLLIVRGKPNEAKSAGLLMKRVNDESVKRRWSCEMARSLVGWADEGESVRKSGGTASCQAHSTSSDRVRELRRGSTWRGSTSTISR